jgi:hypothetical protein
MPTAMHHFADHTLRKSPKESLLFICPAS